jgi:hypothetical protein
VSRQAIAAVLARDDLVFGERLVALSLASFADRENRAWPGAPAAAARAGLCRSRYLQAREQLEARGLVVVDERARGRGRASTVTLAFAGAGPWWDGEINVELFEAVLGYSSARGPARLLLATMAALSDADGTVRDLAAEQLCAAAGVADRTYRRARMSLLESGEIVIVSGLGGRGNTNVWTIADPRLRADAGVRRAPRRVTPPAGARPLVAAAGPWGADTSTVGRASTMGEKGGHDRTVDSANGPILTRVSVVKGGHGQTGFAPEPSIPGRGFGRKRRSGSDAFRAAAVGNPGGKGGRNPGKNSGTHRARVEGTPEPQNPRRPPQPPSRGERAGLDHHRAGLRHRAGSRTTARGPGRPC